MVGIGMGVIPLWYSTGHIWPIGRPIWMDGINLKENGMDIIKGILVGIGIGGKIRHGRQPLGRP
jgi:hypothetical protein